MAAKFEPDIRLRVGDLIYVGRLVKETRKEITIENKLHKQVTIPRAAVTHDPRSNK